MNGIALNRMNSSIVMLALLAAAHGAVGAKYSRLFALHARVAQRPNIAAYLDSERRLSFNQDGVFRHYPELDA